MIDTNHKLVKLSQLVNWQSFDKDWAKLFLSNQGAPATSTRMIAGLYDLKHLYDLSDEQVVERWVEISYWQYFCGEQFFSHHFPIHPTVQEKNVAFPTDSKLLNKARGLLMMDTL